MCLRPLLYLSIQPSRIGWVQFARNMRPFVVAGASEGGRHCELDGEGNSLG